MIQAKQKNIVQPKLKIGQPNDKYEREADRMADAVIRMPNQQIQRQPVEEDIQMKKEARRVSSENAKGVKRKKSCRKSPTALLRQTVN